MRKREQWKNTTTVLFNALVILILIAFFAEEWQTNFTIMVAGREFFWRGQLAVLGLYAALLILFNVIFDGFRVGINKISSVVLSSALALFFANVMEYFIILLMLKTASFAGSVLFSFAILSVRQLIADVAAIFLLTKLFRLIFPPYKTLVIYGDYGNSLSTKLGARADMYLISETIKYDEPEEKIHELIDTYEAVLINDVPSSHRNMLLKYCFNEGKRVYFTPKIPDIFVKSSKEIDLFDTPLYMCSNMDTSVAEAFVKRAIDIFISLVGIIITSPIMLITAIAIKRQDGGPVFYKQRRCTKDGRIFKIMKFRSMIVDAEKDGKARLATENDDRITKVGHFIRATRIDELPQFFNILRGDMSVVGPRPERPEINEEYCKNVPEFAYRLKVKAGLTGYAQVYGKYNTSSYDKLKMDLIYVERHSIALDIKLILMTIKVVLTKDATEGIEEGQTNAGTKKN